MGEFEEIHAGAITGSLTMFDRLIFKGHITRLFGRDAVRACLWKQGVPITEFTEYAKRTTGQIADTVRSLATEAGRPVISFDHVKTRHGANRKDDLARAIADRDDVVEGVICVISAVEPCFSFQVRRNSQTHRVEAVRRERKRLHHYLYLMDREFGFVHIRIQGWIPYEIQIYIDGREWLSRQLDKAGVGYLRYENALLRIDNLDKASQLCERFVHRSWARLLNGFARPMNPVLPAIKAAGFGGY